MFVYIVVFGLENWENTGKRALTESETWIIEIHTCKITNKI